MSPGYTPPFVKGKCENCGKDTQFAQNTVRSCRGCDRVLTIIQDLYKRRAKLDDREVITELNDTIVKEKIKKGPQFNVFLDAKLSGTIPDEKRRKRIVNAVS